MSIKKLLTQIARAAKEAGFIENTGMHGAMTLVLDREDGTREVFHKDNIIVSSGFDFIANAIGNSSSRPAVMGYIALGTSATAPAIGDTTLGTELVRQAATFAHTAGTQTFTFTTTFAAGVGTGAITESGVLNAASAGSLFDHVNFSVVNKGANDTLQVTFTFTMS
jgi:hypothetical protein